MFATTSIAIWSLFGRYFIAIRVLFYRPGTGAGTPIHHCFDRYVIKLGLVDNGLLELRAGTLFEAAAFLSLFVRSLTTI